MMSKWHLRLWGRVVFLLVATAAFAARQKYTVTGLLLSYDNSRRTMTVSCKEIPGYMEAMVMSFAVHDEKLPEDFRPGASIQFNLVVDKESSHAEGVSVQRFESMELDPTQARRLQLLDKATSEKRSSVNVLRVGDAVPNFHLKDQNQQDVSLSQFKGKVVALTFVYTRCPFPDYCVRLSNNFGLLQRRFKERMGRDLILLTVVIDPVHDQPEAIRNYASTWKADPHSWRFLTGSVADVQQLCQRFDMAYYPDEALFVHSFHTAVIGRDGKLVVNLEGNDFTAKQLGDLVEVAARTE